jgi:hypothetical protein
VTHEAAVEMLAASQFQVLSVDFGDIPNLYFVHSAAPNAFMVLRAANELGAQAGVLYAQSNWIMTGHGGPPVVSAVGRATVSAYSATFRSSGSKRKSVVAVSGVLPLYHPTEDFTFAGKTFAVTADLSTGWVVLSEDGIGKSAHAKARLKPAEDGNSLLFRMRFRVPPSGDPPTLKGTQSSTSSIRITLGDIAYIADVPVTLSPRSGGGVKVRGPRR